MFAPSSICLDSFFFTFKNCLSSDTYLSGTFFLFMASFLHVLGDINAPQGNFYKHTWDFFFRTYAVSLFIARIMKVACIINPNASSLISSVRMAGGCLKLQDFFISAKQQISLKTVPGRTVPATRLLGATSPSELEVGKSMDRDKAVISVFRLLFLVRSDQVGLS